MEWYNNTLCVSRPELTGGDNPIMLWEAYRSYVRTHKHVVVKEGKGPGNHTFLNFDKLREDIKGKYVERYGDPHKVAGRYTFRNMVEPDFEATNYFAEYRLPDGRYLTEDIQKEYTANAMILNTLHRVVNDRTALRRALGGSTRNVWPNIARTVADLKPEFGHNLPENHIRLKQKMEHYIENKYMGLISGKFLNDNSRKVKDTMQESTLRQLLRKHTNLDNEQVANLYNLVADALGWDKLTAGSVRNYKMRWDLEIFPGRKGATAFDNERGMTVKRKAPTYPLYYWTMDGWDVELMFQATATDRDGNTRTTYHNRLTLVVVLDPSCKYPVGYAIGKQETPDLIKAALRNAVNHTKALFGEYYKVLQLQTDNYSRKKLQSIYEVLSEKYTPARVHNAKAKVIEPYFNYLNRTYCKMLPNWSGVGVASGSKNQPNGEYLNKIRHNFPDEAGVRYQIELIIERERAITRKAYLEAFANMPEHDKKPIQMDEFLYLMGATTGYTNRLSAPGLVVTIESEKREYDSFDVGFRRHREVDWVVRYNPDDLSQVLATSEDGTLRYMLQEKYVQPMALREREEGDSDALNQIREFNRGIKAEITQGMARDYEVVEEMFTQYPQLEGTLTKLVLCDSMGQHKDRRNELRIASASLGNLGSASETLQCNVSTPVAKAKKLVAKEEKKLELMRQRTWAQEQDEYLDSKVDLTKYL